jgi:EAL domain-containing protein (putative c-di-GMP-specific phosphodiesterase class I)
VIRDPSSVAFRREPIVRLRDGAILGEEWLLDHRPLPDRKKDWLVVVMAMVEKVPVAKTPDDRFISVNADTGQLSCSHFQPLWVALARRCRETHRRLVIEWTESAKVISRDAVNLLACLREDLGVEIAIDDVGSAGLDSLWRITQIRPDWIKVDGNFFHRALTDPFTRDGLRRIVDMANENRIGCIVEWIESAEHGDAASEYGVEYGQGFWWTKPIAQKRTPCNVL